MDKLPSRNIGLDLVRVTETTSLAAGRWVGSGNRDAAHRAATRAMADALNTLPIDGRIVIGEGGSSWEDEAPLCSGRVVGTGEGPKVDVVVDPIDGTNLLIKGHPGAISVVGIAPRGTMRSFGTAVYMEKIIVDRSAADALVPECMNAPAAWTLALVARVKQKAVHDLTVIILDRLRHKELIEEIRHTGASILLRDEGDSEGAILAATPGTGVDMLWGVGGASQGVIAACAVKALGGGMLSRLAPQDPEEWAVIRQSGLDTEKVFTCGELVDSDEIFFSATGITDSALLESLRYHSTYAETHSLLLRSETRTRRFIRAEHHARLI